MAAILFTECDIFCKVVDNFGDIGVCWRLANQLAAATEMQIRLWVDDINLAQRFITHQPANITLCHWQAEPVFTQAAPVVIETFSCGLPAQYQALMQANSVWINIDYLSAEAWVEDFHLKSSPQANGLVRYFYYPGFTPATGGLLAAKQSQAANPLFERLGVNMTPSTLTLSLFCYAHAPMADLISALTASEQAVQILVPDTVAPWLCQALALPSLGVGQAVEIGRVRLIAIPFLSQNAFDDLLATCDFNFVRGEDSWIRAIWAGKPFVWMPYLQDEAAHLAKLSAFLDQYLSDASPQTQTVVRDLMLAWSADGDLAQAWRAFLQHQSAVQAHAQHYATQLALQPDLVTKLVFLIEKLQKNRV